MTPEEFLEARRKHGFNQSDLAKIIGKSPAAISSWERGKVPVPLYMAYVFQALWSSRRVRRLGKARKSMPRFLEETGISASAYARLVDVMPQAILRRVSVHGRAHKNHGKPIRQTSKEVSILLEALLSFGSEDAREALLNASEGVLGKAKK